MSDERERRLAQLRKAFEGGALDEDTYQAAIAGLGAARQDTAVVTGSGAIAQGKGAIAAGAGGVAVVGDVRGNIYLGTPAQDPVRALEIYRRVLVGGCRKLPLRGMDFGASDPTCGRRQFDLDQVYVALDTTVYLDEDQQGRPCTLIPLVSAALDFCRLLQAAEFFSPPLGRMRSGFDGSGAWPPPTVGAWWNFRGGIFCNHPYREVGAGHARDIV